MRHFALSAVGSDRPGIVAAVAGALVDAGCNLEDTSMAILRGHFTMMLVVAAPDDVDAPTIERRVTEAASPFGLVVVVRDLDDATRESEEGAPCTVSVYGADRPGIVHRVSAVLADLGVNIVDLTTRVIGEPDRPVYAMVLDVTLPSSSSESDVRAALERLGTELGVSCTLRSADADVF